MNKFSQMKLLIILLPIVFALNACAAKDSVSNAKMENKNSQQEVSKIHSSFLVEMADARMMDYQEGKLASERGTTPQIRKYGKEMMVDQTQLLNEIKALASQSGVTLPMQISADKSDGLKDLKKLNGSKFDKKFLSMIQIDHERDVKEFKEIKSHEASTAGDRSVMEFANQRLALIEKHLDEVKAIKK